MSQISEALENDAVCKRNKNNNKRVAVEQGKHCYFPSK